jgi:D-glycero-beta-D-manno-heptose 1-phosphate adenylyltransferase
MPTDPTTKIKSLEELITIVAREKGAGKRIVLANGCFDLIHVGHIRYLQDARSKGDILIVGLNTDTSVSRLKGAGRPLQSQDDRAEILASMQCVDYVVLFDEPTADVLLSTLKPHTHAKGTDYTAASVPERNTVLSYGGGVAIAGDPKDHSSRDLIERILSKFRS